MQEQLTGDEIKELVDGLNFAQKVERSLGLIDEAYQKYGDRVRFVLVAVREAHPGSDAPQPRTFDEKVEHAKQLRDLHGHEFEVAVDDIDGT
ncbi:MAG: hypothetical protein IIC81_10435, partial [Chloroflexi bacterium]|nr:hypothetical protein [Chloroflexota bacterium]